MADHEGSPRIEGGESTEFRLLSPQEWPIAREARLAALRESPESFLPTKPQEWTWSAEHWRGSCENGLWAVARSGHTVVGLARLTHEADGPHISSVWTHPHHRRRKIAARLVQLLMDKARGSDVFVWVIQPNEAALQLYEWLGFKRTDETQEINDTGRREERLRFAGVLDRS
jgi:ribosomal protein S18 acetylase RimI-like enzyme